MEFLAPEIYRDNNLKLYKSLESVIQQILPKALVLPNGSSAIPGAISKGDLDIYVKVSPDEFESSKFKLQERDFEVKQDSNNTESLCLFSRIIENVEVDIQLVAAGSEYEHLISFKNKLVERPDLVEKYNDFKMRCSNLSAEEYLRQKINFIYDVLENKQNY